MKIKFILFFFFFITFLFVEQACPKDNKKHIPKIEKSAQEFIKNFYKDLKKEDFPKLKKYFVEIKDEHLQNIIDGHKVYKVDQIEFLEMNIITEKPLEIEIVVREYYKPIVIFKSLEQLFTLKDIGGLNWKILELTEPGLP